MPTHGAYPAAVCVACGERKALRAFHRNASRANGHTPECKICANRRKRAAYTPKGYVRQQRVVATPYVEPGTLHPVWRCEHCCIWLPRTNGGPPPICFHCSEIDETLPERITDAVGVGWIAPEDQVRMVESMRLAPENLEPWHRCPKCGRDRGQHPNTNAIVCRACFLAGLHPHRPRWLDQPRGYHGHFARINGS